MNDKRSQFKVMNFIMNNIVNDKGYNVVHMAIHFHCMSEAEETTLLKSYNYKVNELKKNPQKFMFHKQITLLLHLSFNCCWAHDFTCFF